MKLPTCIICDRALCSDVVNILDKGQRKLVWASTLRNDGKFQKVLDNPIQLHFNCRRKYTNESLVLSAAKKVARENAQVCYVDTAPTDRAHEEDNIIQYCDQTETLQCNSAGERVNESSVETTAIKRDPDLERTNYSNISNIKNDKKDGDSSNGDINQSLSGCINPPLDTAIPQSLPLTNNQCFIEIEVEKSGSEGQNITELFSGIAEEKGNSGKYINENLFKLTTNSSSINGNNELFDYKTQCLFCASDASEDFIKAQKNITSKKKVLVYRISRPQISDNILCHCLHFENNDLSKQVRSRIENKDLKRLSARYHKVCYTKFLTLAMLKHGKRGRPVSKEIHNQMQQVFDYIDNYIEDGTEFSIDDIKRILNLDLNERTMKHKLVTHYGKTIDVKLPNNRVMKRKLVGSNDDSIVPEDSVAAEDLTDQHSGYRCDVCSEDIFRFRYACVQCADCDLCGACEARGEHAAHYVLRVPANKPHVEVQGVLENIRNFLSEKTNNDDSLPAKPQENEEEEQETEPCAEEDPLASPPEDCHCDVSELSEKRTYAKEAPLLTQSDDMEQSEDQKAVSVSISTEPIGMHSGVALYTQLKTEKVEEENLPRSLVKDEPITEETQVASYSEINNGHSSGESQEALYSRPMTRHVEEAIQMPSCSNVMIEPFSKANTKPVYTCMKNESSIEGTQTPRWFGMGPWSGGQSQATYSGVGSGSGVQIANSYTEPNKSLRKRRRRVAAQSTVKRKSKHELLHATDSSA